MKKLLILTYHRYPEGDAPAVRDHSFAKLFESIGYQTTVVGMGESTNFEIRQYDNVNYISLRNKGHSIIDKIDNYFFYVSKLRKYVQDIKSFDAVIVCGVTPHTLFWTKKACKKHNVLLIHDCVEWYSPEQFRMRNLGYGYIVNNMFNKKWIDRQFSVIAISTFLEQHFSSRKIKTLRIPVIMDIQAIQCQKNTQPDKTVFLYAGSPGRKDYLAEIVKGFSLLTKQQLEKVELRILGVKKEQLVSLCGIEQSTVDYLGEHLICFGRVPRQEVLKQLSQADFTVLLRCQTQRYAKAGFPTKVVESLATGTPVITNYTSDLHMYLKDGYNSKIVQDNTPECFANTIKQALELTFNQKQKMYSSARETAEKSFDYRNYKNELNSFITIINN